jgi:hypothetical protein
MIAASARLGLGYAGRLLGDVPDEKFATFARTSDGLIESNHPAFVCGHLSIYAPRILADLGLNASSITPPDSYQALFSKDAICQDDIERKLYPHAVELRQVLIDGYTAVAEALEQADDEILVAENPNEAMRAKFATKGAMHAFYVGGHFMLHMGQVSAWRRAIGMGPA